jgi:hypothetical protein
MKHRPCGPPLLNEFGHARFYRHGWIRVLRKNLSQHFALSSLSYVCFSSKYSVISSVHYWLQRREKLLNWARKYNFHRISCGTRASGGTPRRVATATQPQFPRIAVILSWTHVSEWSSTNWGNGSAVAVQLRLIAILGNCGCQSPWCALALPKAQ